MSQLKEAAENLLKIAEGIEKDAAEVTQFVCESCNHTATLATINEKRIEAAKALDSDVKVGEITVNDKITCPACNGVMAYKETEASAPYYFDPEKEAGEEKEEEEEEEKEEKEASSEPIDYDSLQRYSSNKGE